jgi:hypothetical protein
LVAFLYCTAALPIGIPPVVRLRMVPTSRLPPLLFACFFGASWIVAEEPKLHVVRDTISSDGKYAIAWSANPANDDDPASDWVIDAATSDKILELTGLHYQGDHFRLETAWSADNRYLLVLLGVHFSRYDGTELVLLADTVTRKSVDLSPTISKIFSGKKGKADRPFLLFLLPCDHLVLGD